MNGSQSSMDAEGNAMMMKFIPSKNLVHGLLRA